MSKFDKIIEEVEKLTALELSELVKALEEKFGVSASAPMMAMPMAGAGMGEATAAEEKTAFDVVLKGAGDQKIAVIKIVREVTNKGLQEAKQLVDAAPQTVKSGISKVEADELKIKLEAAGAVVELK
ncbi:MAG: 50S ribosomal protein L7/L12 [Candidatus Azambacteria bacterium]|nr:50S ribosomal protein L7/L12 [Candidatus Azambacteria bacterium]